MSRINFNLTNPSPVRFNAGDRQGPPGPSGGFYPLSIAAGETFIVPANRQVAFVTPPTIAPGGTLQIDGVAHRVRSDFSDFLVGGAGATVTWNSITQQWTVSASGGGGGGGVTDGDKGDVVVSGGGNVWTIDTNAVTNAKIVDVAWAKVTGRPTTLAGYGIVDAQPLNSQLSAIAALSTTTFGRSLLTQADAAATRTLIGAGTSSFNGVYGSLTGIPSTFSPSAHNHSAAEIVSGTLDIARIPTGSTASTVCIGNDSRLSDATTAKTRTDSGTLQLDLDGNGAALPVAIIKGQFRVPYNCTITSWELVSNETGSIEIDIEKDTYANFPPTSADSITGSARPTITASNKAQSSTLTGWATALNEGDYLKVEVLSVSAITQASLTLRVTRT